MTRPDLAISDSVCDATQGGAHPAGVARRQLMSVLGRELTLARGITDSWNEDRCAPIYSL